MTDKEQIIEELEKKIKEVEKQKLDLSNTTDPAAIAELTQKISDAEDLAKEKHVLSTISAAKVKTLKQKNSEANNTDNNITAANNADNNIAVTNSENKSSAH